MMPPPSAPGAAAPPASLASPADASAAEWRDLVAPIPGSPGGGVVATFVAAVLTFGLWPALVWPLRFRHLTAVERGRFRRASEWLRLRTAHPEARQLDKALAEVRFRPRLYLVAAFACAALIVFVVMSPGPVVPGGHNYGALLAHAYAFHGPRHGHWLEPARRLWAGPPSVRKLFTVWSACLSLAFAAHWLQVHLYAQSVRRFLNVFNKIVIHEALSPVFLRPLGVGLRPLWVLGAAAMVAIGAPWGVPLMLAGAVQRAYVCRAGHARAGLAARLRDMSLLHRMPASFVAPMAPPMPAPAPPVPPAPRTAHAAPRMRCSTDGCRLPLPAGALFCPRCGRRAAPPLDRVA